MWARRWDAGGMRQGAWQEPSAGPWRHGEMANVWQAASNAGSGERSKNFLIHQRTHLGLGQAPQRFALCTCVCVGVCVCWCWCASATNAKTITKTLLATRHPTTTTTRKTKTAKGGQQKVKTKCGKCFKRAGGEGRKKNFLLGPLAVEAVVVVLTFFFYRLLPSFLLSCFHCHVKSGKKAKQTRGRQEKMEGECEREGDSNKAKHLNLHNFRSTSQM